MHPYNFTPMIQTHLSGLQIFYFRLIHDLLAVPHLLCVRNHVRNAATSMSILQTPYNIWRITISAWHDHIFILLIRELCHCTIFLHLSLLFSISTSSSYFDHFSSFPSPSSSSPFSSCFFLISPFLLYPLFYSYNLKLHFSEALHGCLLPTHSTLQFLTLPSFLKLSVSIN